jgi:hypothetical protein
MSIFPIFGMVEVGFMITFKSTPDVKPITLLEEVKLTWLDFSSPGINWR